MSWPVVALLIAAAACGGGTDGTPVAPPAAPAPPPLPAAPGQPTGIRVVDVGVDFLVWAWEPVQTATSYEAHVFPDGTPPTERPPLQVAAEPTFRADGLEPDTLMGIFVRAIRETAGDRVVGPWSDYGTGKTLPPPEPEPPPGQPTGIRVVDAGTDFLVWAWDPVETATGYEAHAFPDGTPPTERPPLQITVEPTFRADGLEPDTLTRILVRAIRETAGGRAVGPWSEYGTGMTAPVPEAPAAAYSLVLEDHNGNRGSAAELGAALEPGLWRVVELVVRHPDGTTEVLPLDPNPDDDDRPPYPYFEVRYCAGIDCQSVWNSDNNTFYLGLLSSGRHTVYLRLIREDEEQVIELEIIVPASTLDVRSTRDRPDEVHGLQIHPIYVIPSDGEDRELDRNGRVARSLQITVDWLTERVGRRLRVDTFEGEPDVTFLQLDATASDVANSPESSDHIWDAIRESRGSSENKIYAVYYSVEGGSGLYFAGFTPTGTDGPGPRGPALVVIARQPLALGAGLGWYEAVMAHELFHVMGAVRSCAPNHIVGDHVDDDPYDLMYIGDGDRMGWDPDVNRELAVDAGNDDYYGHHVPGCVDTEDSPLWMDPPGGLPAETRPMVRVLPSAMRPIRCWRH